MLQWNISNIEMLYYDRIDISEGIDVNKISASNKCDICHYWYFLKYSMSAIDVMLY